MNGAPMPHSFKERVGLCGVPQRRREGSKAARQEGGGRNGYLHGVSEAHKGRPLGEGLRREAELLPGAAPATTITTVASIAIITIIISALTALVNPSPGTTLGPLVVEKGFQSQLCPLPPGSPPLRRRRRRRRDCFCCFSGGIGGGGWRLPVL